MRKALLLLFAGLLLTGCSSRIIVPKEDNMGFNEKEISKTIKKEINSKFLLYLPKDYKATEKYPLVIFLHGSGERGNDLNKVKIHGVPRQIKEGKEFPFIMVAPQCPEGEQWSNDVLNELYLEIVNTYSVDTNRVYLTGLSMGGYGTWAFAEQYPDRFAAIVPICGGGKPYNVWVLKNVPVWVFHGTKDMAVPFNESENMVNFLKKAGGNVKFTVIENGGHDVWTDAYKNPELYEWMLAQSKKGAK